MANASGQQTGAETGAKMTKSHIVTVAWQAWHNQCSWEYIYIWELELHPGISPTLIHTEKYDLCIWEYTLYILECTLYIWEYN